MSETSQSKDNLGELLEYLGLTEEYRIPFIEASAEIMAAEPWDQIPDYSQLVADHTMVRGHFYQIKGKLPLHLFQDCQAAQSTDWYDRGEMEVNVSVVCKDCLARRDQDSG